MSSHVIVENEGRIKICRQLQSKLPVIGTFTSIQGSQWLEKYLNIQDCLEKSLKIKFALKSTGKILKGLEKSLNFTIYRRIQPCLWRSKSV